ncbi:MAG: SRPBCC family protein [Simkaniaceae bacterium]|nr:SRPBCC family protein [Simkaniaceae bacterium]
MFQLRREYSFEVDVPIEEVWEFSSNCNNWISTNERIENFLIEGPFAAGAKVKVKIKGKDAFVTMWITEVIQNKVYKVLLDFSIYKIETSMSFERSGSDKTRITESTYVSGLIVPFMKSKLLKDLEEQKLLLTEQYKNLEKQSLVNMNELCEILSKD